MSFNAIISADVKNFEAGIAKSSAAIDKLEKSVSEKMAKIGGSIQNAGKKASIFSAAIVAAGALTVKSFITQEKAERKLDAAIRATGGNVEELSKRFRKFASDLQAVTVVGDETTLGMLQMGQTMGLSADQSERAVKNAIAMESAFGVASASAMRYTAALEQGDATMLKRYIPALRGIEDETLLAAKAQEILSGAFDVAKEDAQTFGGQLAQLKNSFGDLMEEFGAVIAEYLKPLIARLRDIVRRFSELDAKTKKMIVTITAIAAAIGPVLLIVGSMITAFSTLGTAIAAITSPIGLVIAAVAALAAGIAYVWDNWAAVKERISDITWWKNALIEMVNFFAKINPFALLIEAYNELIKLFGGTGFKNPYLMMASGLELLKDDTKEYEHQFGSFMDTVRKGMSAVTGLFDGVSGSAGAATNAVKDFAKSLAPEKMTGLGIEAAVIAVPELAPINYDRYAESLKEINEMTLELGGIITNGITGLASSIGEAFASGNFENIGSGLISAMGEMISQFGEMLVASGMAALALKLLIKNPLTAIAAGAALIALGAAATAAAQKTVDKTTGGGGYSGGTTSYNQTSRLGESAYRGAYRDEWNDEVVFRIGNNELVGTLARANNRNNRL